MADLVPCEEDVAAAVKARLEAGVGYATAIPGGVHYNRRPPGSTFPYVVLTVESADREAVETCWDGTRRYVSYAQRFTVTATAWVKSLPTIDTESATVRAFLDANLGGGPASLAGQLTVNNSVGVIQALRKGGRLRLAPVLRSGQDVLATSVILEVMVEGRQE